MSGQNFKHSPRHLLQLMKITKAYMHKVGAGIKEAVQSHELTEGCDEWMQHANEIDCAANVPLQSWIDELEKIVKSEGDIKNELSKL
jgi:hypothetical protein